MTIIKMTGTYSEENDTRKAFASQNSGKTWHETDLYLASCCVYSWMKSDLPINHYIKDEVEYWEFIGSGEE